MANPKKVDLQKIEALAQRGLTLEQIAAALGISARTLHRRKAAMADVAGAIEKGQALGIAHVTNKLMELINGGNVVAAIFYLKARAGWKDHRIELTGKDDGPIKTIARISVSPDDALRDYQEMMQGKL